MRSPKSRLARMALQVRSARATNVVLDRSAFDTSCFYWLINFWFYTMQYSALSTENNRRVSGVRSSGMKLYTWSELHGGNSSAGHSRFYEEAHLGAEGHHDDDPRPNAECRSRATRSPEDTILHARMSYRRRDRAGWRADVPPERFQPMRSAYPSLLVRRVRRRRSAFAPYCPMGAMIFMKMEETFFAFRFAMLRDKFGTSWMILHERPRRLVLLTVRGRSREVRCLARAPPYLILDSPANTRGTRRDLTVFRAVVSRSSVADNSALRGNRKSASPMWIIW